MNHTLKKSNIERLTLIIYLMGFFVMAVTMMLYQPHVDHISEIPLSPPDEYFRMLIPKFICEHGTLPTGLEEEVRITGCGFSYGLYNVLPYIIQGYFMRFVNLFTDSELALLYAGRSINVQFGMLMAWVVYLLGKRIFRDNRFRWLFCFAVLKDCLSILISIQTPAVCSRRRSFYMRSCAAGRMDSITGTVCGSASGSSYARCPITMHTDISCAVSFCLQQLLSTSGTSGASTGRICSNMAYLSVSLS